MRLSAEGLAASRGGRRVFAGLSFAVEAGGALVLNGPNGSGKSTLLRLIAGLLRPDGGTIRLEGGDPETALGAQCHYVGHLDAVKPALSARENVGFWTSFLGRGDTREALAAIGLDHLADTPAGLLSAGQKRRLALARLAAVQRPVWLLDEPTVSLDEGAVARLDAMMTDHLASGGLLVVATHVALDIAGAGTLALAGPGG